MSQASTPSRPWWPRAVRALEDGTCRLHGWLALGAGLIAVLLVLLTVADVVGRFFFNSPVPGTVEITQVILPFIIWTGFSYALVTESHVKVTLLQRRVGPRTGVGLEVLADLFGVVVFTVLLREGWALFWSSWQIKELAPAAVTLPYWPSKFLVPAVSLAMVVQFLLRFLVRLSRGF